MSMQVDKITTKGKKSPRSCFGLRGKILCLILSLTAFGVIFSNLASYYAAHRAIDIQVRSQLAQLAETSVFQGSTWLADRQLDVQGWRGMADISPGAAAGGRRGRAPVNA